MKLKTTLIVLTAAVAVMASAVFEAALAGRFNDALELGTPQTRYKGKKVVDYATKYASGTIIINTKERALYFVMGGGKAMKYGVGVGRRGFSWSGAANIAHKAKWPAWRPPAAMRKREPHLPEYMPGGPNNPLGARALYLGGSLYRIHGTNNPSSIGQAQSSGCIRLLNDEIVDLYRRVQIGAKVIVV